MLAYFILDMASPEQLVMNLSLPDIGQQRGIAHNGAINGVEQDIDLDGYTPNKEMAFALWDTIETMYSNVIPGKDIQTTRERLTDMFTVWEEPKEAIGRTATAAFFVHTRRMLDGPLEFDDTGRCLPALKQEYGIAEGLVDALWNTLPPFETGRITGTLSDGTNVDCAIISVPITPVQLSQRRGVEKIRYARPRIEAATTVAKKFGANIVGLGETLAALTLHGQKLQENHLDIRVATGHAFTTHFINEWTHYAAAQLQKDLGDVSVTILGARGSIGSATAHMLAEKEVGSLVLHDTEENIGKLYNDAEKLEESYPHMRGKINVSGGEYALRDACKAGEIIVSAVSAPKPIVFADHLNAGTYYIDDSQPTSTTRQEAEKAGAYLMWVVGELPKGITRTFDYGLIDRAEWGCALEVVALHSPIAKNLKTVGPVDPDRVNQVQKIAEKLGIGLPTPQNFSKPIAYNLFVFDQAR